jgi:hypothetical protein
MTMKRILLTTVAFWVLLLSPGLCVAGALEHVCAGCPEGITCEHEEDCTADPCGEVLLRPEVASSTVSIPVAVLPQSFITSGSSVLDPEHLLRVSHLPARRNLPRPQSDLPLLI